MAKNVTLNDTTTYDYMHNGTTFNFGKTGGSKGYLQLKLTISNIDLLAHTLTLTSDWYWHTTWTDAQEAWDYNSSSNYQYFKLYTTGTSSSSGTSKTYYLYTGGNRKSYGTLYASETYFNWNYAYHRGPSTYGDINYNVTNNSTNLVKRNTVTVDLAKDNSLSMSIACSLKGTTNTYGPYDTGTAQSFGSYTLTVEPGGGIVRLNVDGTWKDGLVWINDNGTWKQSTAVFTNNNGTWTRNA